VIHDRFVLARTLEALQPYADEVVLIGGWVHELYVVEANSPLRAVRTTDIDVTLPQTLIRPDRPPLLELLTAVGYRVVETDETTGVIKLEYGDPDGDAVPLDLLTEADDARRPIEIEGQPGLVVSGYPNQEILRTESRWMTVGPALHPTLSNPVRVRVPTLGAYVLVKALSSSRRSGPTRVAKDLVYLLQILRDEGMHKVVVDELHDLAASYPEEYRVWRTVLQSMQSNYSVLGAMAEQLIGSSSLVVASEADAVAFIQRQFRRVLAETPG
jgi:hypothetical protein